MKTIYESNSDLLAKIEVYKKREQELENQKRMLDEKNLQMLAKEQEYAARVQELDKKEESIKQQQIKIKQNLLETLAGGKLCLFLRCIKN